MTLSSFFTGKRLIHKLLLNPKPYGPYVFVAALEDTRFCLAKEINFKINIAHKINVYTSFATGSSFHHALRIACCFAQKNWIVISQ